MPELSRFFGIMIGMFVEAAGSHRTPHCHAYYQDQVAVYDIDKIELLAGALPRRQERLALACAELHRPEWIDAWRTLRQGRSPAKIEPLK
jgi:hypothetical protein